MATNTLKGFGQMNGVVPINKTIEIVASQVRNFTGSKRNDAILAVCAVHFPGVKIKTGQVVAHGKL